MLPSSTSGNVVTTELRWLGFSKPSAQDSIPANQEIRYDEQSLSPVEFDDDLINELKNNPDFDYTEGRLSQSWWTLFKEWVSNLWSDFWGWVADGIGANNILAFIIEILPYIILIGLVIMAVWLFIKLDPGGKVLETRRIPGVNLSGEEEIIRSENISELIAKAVREKNFRLAVRYYYLLILKKLRDQDLIDYQFQKTNAEYLAEIKSELLKREFQNITRIYDFIWYGNFRVSETQFKRAETEFKQFQAELIS